MITIDPLMCRVPCEHKNRDLAIREPEATLLGHQGSLPRWPNWNSGHGGGPGEKDIFLVYVPGPKLCPEGSHPTKYVIFVCRMAGRFVKLEVHEQRLRGSVEQELGHWWGTAAPVRGHVRVRREVGLGKERGSGWLGGRRDLQEVCSPCDDESRR